jgi:hypothetical protein
MPTKHWSFQATVGTDVPVVDPRTLSPVERRVLWVGMQVVEPELARMLADDERLKLLLGEFDGRIVFERERAERFYRAGRAAKGGDETGTS